MVVPKIAILFLLAALTPLRAVDWRTGILKDSRSERMLLPTTVRVISPAQEIDGVVLVIASDGSEYEGASADIKRLHGLVVGKEIQFRIERKKNYDILHVLSNRKDIPLLLRKETQR